MRRTALLIALLLAAASASAQTLCNPLDPLPGTVLRDAHAVPHVFAGNLDDRSFINGYVQAV